MCLMCSMCIVKKFLPKDIAMFGDNIWNDAFGQIIIGYHVNDLMCRYCNMVLRVAN